MQFDNELDKFDYRCAQLRDVKTYGVRSTRTGRITITGIEIHKELYAPSLCFWRSFFIRFDVPIAVLRIFQPSEILERVKWREGDTEIHYCVKRDDQGDGTIALICANKSIGGNRLTSLSPYDACENYCPKLQASVN